MNEETKTERQSDSNEGVFLSIHVSDLWRGIVKFWPLCCVLVLLCAMLVAWTAARQYVPVYECSATFTVDTQSSVQSYSLDAYEYYYNRITANQLAETFPYILRSSILQEKICDSLGLTSLPGTIAASSLSGTNLFTLRVRAYTAEYAYDILTAAIEEYPQVAEYVLGTTKLHTLSAPVMPDSPINPFSWSQKAIRGAAFGVLLSAAWIVIYALSRKTIRTRDDIRNVLHTECIGTIPQVVFRKYRREIDAAVLMTNPLVGNGFMESVRALRNSLLHTLNDKEKVMMVTSTAPGEGKTTVTVNAAVSLASVQKKVLLIDADLRNPSVIELLSSGQEDDFIPATIPIELPQSMVMQYASQHGLTVMTFRADTKLWSAINSRWLAKWIKQLRPLFDYIIIDTPPCGLLTDASIVAEASDAVLYVVDQDGVRTSRICAAMDTVLGKNARFIGCVLNNVAAGIAGYGNRYGYGYGYGKYGKYGKYGAYGSQKRSTFLTSRRNTGSSE